MRTEHSESHNELIFKRNDLSTLPPDVHDPFTLKMFAPMMVLADVAMAQRAHSLLNTICKRTIHRSNIIKAVDIPNANAMLAQLDASSGQTIGVSCDDDIVRHTIAHSLLLVKPRDLPALIICWSLGDMDDVCSVISVPSTDGTCFEPVLKMACFCELDDTPEHIKKFKSMDDASARGADAFVVCMSDTLKLKVWMALRKWSRLICVGFPEEHPPCFRWVNADTYIELTSGHAPKCDTVIDSRTESRNQWN